VKYYVVSDRDLLRLKHTAQVFGDAPNSDTCDELDSAESVCYSRPVRFIGAHGEGSSLMLWGEE